MSRNRSEKSVARRDPLDSRLSGYSAGAKLAAAASRLRSRTGNWPVYAAAAGSALAMTTSASASIISGVPGPHGSVSVRTNATTTGALLYGPQLLLRAEKHSTGAYGPFIGLSVQAFSPLSIFVGGPGGQYGGYVKNFARSASISNAAGYKAQGAKIVASATTH